jgi:imidazolonepropionase-like amidohydrolase
MKLTIPRPLLLRGKVVQPDGSAVDRYLLVRNGVIEAVSRRRPPLTDDAMIVETGPNDWIFPGLIDLHTHTGYNVMPGLTGDGTITIKPTLASSSRR